MTTLNRINLLWPDPGFLIEKPGDPQVGSGSLSLAVILGLVFVLYLKNLQAVSSPKNCFIKGVFKFISIWLYFYNYNIIYKVRNR